MLVTMLTFLFVFVYLQISLHFERKPEPLPYMVSQPLPWQIHSVSHSRKNSRVDEVNSNASNGTCTNSTAPPLSPVEVEKAAATIQTHFRKFQQKKHKNGK
uniref:Uncharacterized protein n=1 Tax=Periophthalmus magnuspinnatus TaxID=409849 RepID=A0A3B4A4S0_9GOBI